MDAFGYKLEEDGNTWFSWVFINEEGKTLWLTGILGEVQGQFLELGEEYSADSFESKTIPMLEGLDYIFDFNDRCQELLIRFPLANINDLANFRFKKVEPLIHSAFQKSGNGFCDYGYCDEGYLNMVPWVYSVEAAIKTLSTYLPKVVHATELNYSVWTSDNGVPQKKLWSYHL